MSRAATTLFAFGVYVTLAGIVIIAAPHFVVEVLRLPAAPNGFVRLIGLLSLVIGAYDIVSARNDYRNYIRASIFVRLGFALGTLLLVLIAEMPSTLLLLGAIDVAGAIWTAIALRRS